MEQSSSRTIRTNLWETCQPLASQILGRPQDICLLDMLSCGTERRPGQVGRTDIGERDIALENCFLQATKLQNLNGHGKDELTSKHVLHTRSCSGCLVYYVVHVE